jgi:hypothetical protein
MNESKIGSSIGEFVCTLENNKFIVSCVLHSFTLCTRSTGAIKNIQFLVVVTTSTSKKLTYHAMLRDNTSKLCCTWIMKQKRGQESKGNVFVTLPRSLSFPKKKKVVISCLNKSIAWGYCTNDHCWW